jgi:hypothetical protein
MGGFLRAAAYFVTLNSWRVAPRHMTSLCLSDKLLESEYMGDRLLFQIVPGKNIDMKLHSQLMKH